MNKKTIIILIVAIIVVSTLVGVLCWGLQPVQKDSVTLEKLNKELGTIFCIPSQLPFEGETNCFIIYNEQHQNIRFEISSDDITGYSIEHKDSNRYISIGTNGMMPNIAEQEGAVKGNYNNQEIYYIFDKINNNSLIMQFTIEGKTYQLNAQYDKSVNGEILKSDVECILNQMIKL